VKSFVDAMRFLTRLPMPAASDASGFGAGMFPLVGLVLGLLSLAVDSVLGSVDVTVRNVAILATAAAATGAIHYDGLADTLDGFGGATREERLRILRDGTIGTYAVLGLVFVVVAELAALGAMPGDLRARALLVAPVAGRAAMVWCAVEAPLARSDGLGAAFVRALAPADTAIASATTVVLMIGLGGFRGALAGLLAGVTSFSLRRMAAKRFGGVTGDVIGAAGKASEVLVLLCFAAS